MPTELTVLTLAALLQLLQYALMAIPANLELGTGKTLSPRDRDRLGGSLESQVSAKTARLIRALDNHFEALILFTIAVLVVNLSGQASAFTDTCAWLFLMARALYVPAYAYGWVPWRSVIWAVGWLATGLMLISVLV